MDESPKDLVLNFINQVRSGKAPERAVEYMAEEIIAHQVNSGSKEVITRTPENYTEHIHEFLTCYGQFKFEVQEVLADGNKVYVRWLQEGKHLTNIMGFEPTGKMLSTVGSAVYRVENGFIKEYWIQQENLGLLEQLQHNQK